MTSIDITKFSLTIDRGEKVLKVVRRHRIFAVMIGLFAFFFLAVIPFVAIIFFGNQARSALPEIQAVAIVFSSIYFLVVSFFAFAIWIDYYLDMGIITTKRIIDIDQDGFFSRKMSQLYLTKIQDVSATQRGLIANMFDFGDVFIQSAAEVSNFLWVKIPKPFFVSEWLLDLQLRAKRGGGRISDEVTEPSEAINPPEKEPEIEPADTPNLIEGGSEEADDEKDKGSILK